MQRGPRRRSRSTLLESRAERQPSAAARSRSVAEAENSQLQGLVRRCHGATTLWFFCEARLDKMLIECKSPLDAQLLHDKERDAIREGVVLVLMALEIRPSFVK